LKVVQGWSTSCAAGVHRNCIVLHQVEAALQGNAWPTYSVPGLSPFAQAKKRYFQLHNQA